MVEIGSHTTTERVDMVTLHLRDARAQVLPDPQPGARYHRASPRTWETSQSLPTKSGVVYLTQKTRPWTVQVHRPTEQTMHLAGGSTRSRETRDRLAKGWRGVLRTHGTDEGGECRGRSGRPAGGTGGTNERIGWRKHDDTQRSRKHVNETRPNS